ncbi:MAG: class I SAM-dependent methyltransferase [Pseudomonadota bacterium]
MTVTELDTAWAEKYGEFPNTGMNTNKTRDVFVRNGSAIFQALEQAVMDYAPGSNLGEMTVLDFGCGIGRVAMPFHHKYGRPTHACDVLKKYVDWLSDALPDVDIHRSGMEPPLKFDDETFDLVYSISVWTHMDNDAGTAWLQEIKRVLKPGGMALISTSSYGQLEKHRKHRLADRKSAWEGVTDEQVKEEGVVFRGNEFKNMGEAYGVTIHDPDYVMREWSKIMPVQETRIRNIGGAAGGSQDLNIMIKEA